MADGVKRIGEFIGKQADEATRRHTTLHIGDFMVELKPPAEQKRRRGVMNMAEVSIVVECDARQTCAFIRSREAKARDEITNVLTALERDDLMSVDGKRKIKKALIDRLNGWLPTGKIEHLYFQKLIIL